MRYNELLRERSDEPLKKDIIDLVKKTDDTVLLNKVLTALKSTDLIYQISSKLKNKDFSQKILQDVANIIIHVEGTIQEKEEFASNLSSGFIDTSKLLKNGTMNSFDSFIKNDFAYRVFDKLSSFTLQGIGPCEIAFASLGKGVLWTGQTGGGGDLTVGGTKVELKTKIESGGRWGDLGKAKLDNGLIKSALIKAGIKPVPTNLTAPTWANSIRPTLDKKGIVGVAEAMADGTYPTLSPNYKLKFKKAIATGSSEEICKVVLECAFEYYKKYNGFDGILLVDLPKKVTLYFSHLDEGHENLKSGSISLYSDDPRNMLPRPEISAAAIKATVSGTPLIKTDFKEKPKEPTSKLASDDPRQINKKPKQDTYEPRAKKK